MGNEVILAIIGLMGIVLGGFVTHSLPKWIEQRRSPTSKEEAEAEGIRWKNLVQEIERNERKVAALEERVGRLEREKNEAIHAAATYHAILTQNNIEIPDNANGLLTRLFPVPGAMQ